MVETTKMSASEVAAEHATESHAPYLKVWAGLAVLTLVEYYYASIFKSQFLILLLGLLFLAVVKAGMVGWYFMHLKFEGKWVYIMIVPAMILATIIVLALTPDMVLKPETEENQGEEYARIAPATERPGTILAARAESPDPRASARGSREGSVNQTL
jgi:cytochrome c oxidase subunit IV